MSHRYVLADVFTHRAFGGNPLGVFPDASDIPTELMQPIAAELNLSETAFLVPHNKDRRHWNVRIFTPRIELPFAGHPTVGSACVLAWTGAVELENDEASIVLHETVGSLRTVVKRISGIFKARFQLPILPAFGPPPPDRGDLARMLNLQPADIGDGELAPCTASAGVPYVFIPVRDRDALARASIDTDVWRRTLASFWAPHVYVFTRDVEQAASTVRARMFAPAMGIQEDPATGAAAAGIARYLADAASYPVGMHDWRIEQGFEMGRPSIIELAVSCADGDIAHVEIGGSSVIVGEGNLLV